MPPSSLRRERDNEARSIPEDLGERDNEARSIPEDLRKGSRGAFYPCSP